MAKTKVKTKDEDTEANMSEILTDSVYINPLTDFGFKWLFYNKEVQKSGIGITGQHGHVVVPVEKYVWFEDLPARDNGQDIQTVFRNFRKKIN